MKNLIRIPMILILVFLVAVQSSIANPVCIGYYAGKHLVEPEHFDIGITRKWDKELIAAYNFDGGSRKELLGLMDRVWPTPKEDYRSKAERFFYRTRNTILSEVGKIRTGIARTGNDNLNPMDLLTQIQGAIRNTHVKDNFTAQLMGKEIAKFEQKTKQAIKDSQAADVPFSDIKSALEKYQKQIEVYKEKYGSEFFPEEVTLKSGFDVFAMTMLGRLAGKRPPSLESIYALSLLHPITDNALDSKQFDVSGTMKKISKLIAGEDQVATNKYETLVFDFIRQILKDFPPESDPLVRDTLLALHQEQLKSVHIQESGVEAAVLDNTLRKGALTYLLFARLGLGHLTEGQQKYFYKAGSILQLIDDYLDVRSDIAEKKATPWTIAYEKNKGDLTDPLLRMVKILGDLKVEAGSMLGDMPQKEKIVGSFEFATKLFLMAGTMDSLTYDGIQSVMAKRLPMKPQAMQTVAYSMMSHLNENPGSEAFFMKILDMGFLNGKFASDSLDPNVQKSMTGLANKWAPSWWMTMASSKLHNGFSKLWTSPGGRETLLLITIAFGASHMYGYHSNLKGTGFEDLFMPTYLGLYWTMNGEKPWRTLTLASLILGASFFIPKM